jgi:excisionase family DNA binding protein
MQKSLLQLNEAESVDKALTTEDACQFLSISRQTLYKLVKSKKIPGRKVGDNYRFLKSDLIRYFKND